MNMGNIIQHYNFNDTSKYERSYKLNTTIDKLNEIQTEERKGSFSVVEDCAAMVEISELAKAMYESSVGTQKQEKEENEALAEPAKQKESAPNEEISGKQEKVNPSDDKNKYAGLSGVEREVKELEDYIASHPVDTSLDLLRKGSLSKNIDGNSINLVDHALVKAENEYTEAFASVSKDFADFSMKITYGDYSNNDVSINDLNLDAIDKMEQTYQSYKDQIQANYKGAEADKYLSKLDDVYNSVFAEKIIKPIKEAYDDKLVFFKPDSEETVKSIKAASTDKEHLQEMISGYLTNQSIKEHQYNVLSDKTSTFYDMVNNKSMWHDSETIKNILTDTMNAYSSVKEIKPDSSEYQSAKKAADAVAKKVSDQYAESVEYRMEKLGLSKNGINVEEDQSSQKSIDDYITNSSNGMFMVDFSKISDLSILKVN